MRCRVIVVWEPVILDGAPICGKVKISQNSFTISLNQQDCLDQFGIPYWEDSISLEEYMYPLLRVGCHELAHVYVGSDEDMAEAVACIISSNRRAIYKYLRTVRKEIRKSYYSI